MTIDSRLVVALSVVALLAGVVLLYEGRSVLIPIVLSVLVSYALDPVVSWLERRSVPRLAGTTLVMLLLTGGIMAVVYGLSYQATAIVDELPRAARTVREHIRSSRQPGGTLGRHRLRERERPGATPDAARLSPLVSSAVRR